MYMYGQYSMNSQAERIKSRIRRQVWTRSVQYPKTKKQQQQQQQKFVLSSSMLSSLIKRKMGTK